MKYPGDIGKRLVAEFNKGKLAEQALPFVREVCEDNIRDIIDRNTQPTANEALTHWGELTAYRGIVRTLSSYIARGENAQKLKREKEKANGQ